MSEFNFHGSNDIPDDAQFGDQYNIGVDLEEFIEMINAKIDTATRARKKKPNGSPEWEFWNGKVRAYSEIRKELEHKTK